LVEQLIPIGPLYGISVLRSSTIAAAALESTSSHQELNGSTAAIATAAAATAAAATVAEATTAATTIAVAAAAKPPI
jgi:hypothetical protein